MVVSAVEQAGEVPGFTDRLGDRLVVSQPSGALLEFLRFEPPLSSAAFFESAVKTRLKRLSNFRHGAYSRATRLQRDPSHGNCLTLVSVYTPGRRLSDVLLLAKRGGIQPRIPAVLSLTRQLMTGVALLHDYAPDVFHGAIGTDRLVVTPDGHLVITEYVLGSAVEQGVSEWGSVRLWRDYRIATLSDTTLSRFGRRLDLVQIGLVTLSLLLGRPMREEEYPARLVDLLQTAQEHTGEGDTRPIRDGLREWLAKLLCLDPSTSFRTLIEAQKALVRLVEDEPGYGVSSHALEAFFQQCEEASQLAVASEPSTAVALAPASETGPTDIPSALPLPAVAEEPQSSSGVVSPAGGGQSSPEECEPAPAEVPAQAEEPAVADEASVDVAPAAPVPVAVPEPPVAEARPEESPAIAPAPVVTAEPRPSLEEAARAAAEDAEPAALPVVPPASATSPALEPSPAPGQGDPFGPWPVVVGSDTVATLFDTFKAPDATRESPVVHIPAPDSAPAEATAAAQVWAAGGAAASVEALGVVTNAWDQGPAATAEPAQREWADSTDATAARQLRETLFEAPPAGGHQDRPLSEPPAVQAPAWEPSFAPQPGRPSVEVVVVEPPALLRSTAQPPAAPVAPAAAQAPRSADSLRPVEAVRGMEWPAAEESAPTDRRQAPAVLSYEEVHSAAAPKRSKMPLVIAAAAVLVLAVVGVVAGPRVLSMVRSGEKPNNAAPPPASAGAPGGFKITTQPPGGKITIDGTPRGTAPLKVEDLAPGLHSITVESEWGTIEEAVNVESGKVSPLVLSTIGWIRVESPVELEVSEEGRSFGKVGAQLMVPAGRHHFVFVNQTVAVRLRQFVDVPAGQVVKVALDLPPGMLNLTSEQPAQVLLDGEVIGDTPLVSVPAKLGPHEIIFRSTRYGDVSYSVNVTLAAPIRLNCTFAKR
jgi:hypothetical protein